MKVKMKIVSRKSLRTNSGSAYSATHSSSLARHSSPKRPDGLKSRMATSTARP